MGDGENLRGGDDDLGIDQLFIEGRVLTLLIRGCHQRMSLIFQPFANAQFVFSCAQEFRHFSGVLFALSMEDLSPNVASVS